MAQQKTTAAERVGENTLIMGEVFRWLSRRGDLRNCVLLSKNHFEIGIKPLWSLLDRDIFSVFVGTGSSLVRFNQYAGAVHALHCDVAFLSNPTILLNCVGVFPNLECITILRTDGYRVRASIKLFTLPADSPPSPTAAPARRGDLTLRIYSAGTRARLLPLLGQGKCFGLKVLSFEHELWSWETICQSVGMDLNGQMRPASVDLLSEVEDLSIYGVLSLQDLAKLLVRFPGFKALRLYLSLPDKATVTASDLGGLILNLQRRLKNRLEEVSIAFADPAAVQEGHTMLERMLRIGGIKRLAIQHAFCSRTSCFAHGTAEDRTMTLANFAGVKDILQLDIEPFPPEICSSPIDAALAVYTAFPNHTKVRLMILHPPRQETDLKRQEEQANVDRWVSRANETLISLQMQGRSVGYRNVDLADIVPAVPIQVQSRMEAVVSAMPSTIEAEDEDPLPAGEESPSSPQETPASLGEESSPADEDHDSEAEVEMVVGGEGDTL